MEGGGGRSHGDVWGRACVQACGRKFHPPPTEAVIIITLHFLKQPQQHRAIERYTHANTHTHSRARAVVISLPRCSPPMTRAQALRRNGEKREGRTLIPHTHSAALLDAPGSLHSTLFGPQHASKLRLKHAEHIEMGFVCTPGLPQWSCHANVPTHTCPADASTVPQLRNSPAALVRRWQSRLCFASKCWSACKAVIAHCHVYVASEVGGNR